MSKKIIACLLMFSMLIGMTGTFASADTGFTLRNGIQFGDTMEQVRAKETLGWDAKNTNDTRLWTEAGTVASISGVQIAYFFDSEGKLNDVKWECPPYASMSNSNADYELLYNALVKKYGPALNIPNGYTYSITGTALTGALAKPGLMKMFGMYGAVHRYAEWDYKYSDTEHVKIEIVQHSIGNTSSNAAHYVWVGYKFFTDADIQDVIDQKEQDEQAIMNDI